MQRGYTLLELSLVILIMGIVLMVAAPRLAPRLTETRLDTSARQLATFCRYLNAQAVLTKVHYTLQIDIDAREYWVTTVAAPETGGLFQKTEDVEDVEITSDLLHRKKLPEGVRFQGVVLSVTGETDRGTVMLDFTPVGPVERMLVHLTNDAGSELTVFFDPMTGTSGILEGYAEALDERSLGWVPGA